MDNVENCDTYQQVGFFREYAIYLVCFLCLFQEFEACGGSADVWPKAQPYFARSRRDFRWVCAAIFRTILLFKETLFLKSVQMSDIEEFNSVRN
jgi:hypothetical protein